MKPVVSKNAVHTGAYDSSDKFTLSDNYDPNEQMYDNSRLRREIGQYLQSLKNQGLTNRYVTQNKVTLMAFLEHCKENEIGCSVRVNAETILSFLRKYEGYSASYQKHQQSVLRNFLKDNGNIAMISMKINIRGTSRTNVDWLSPEESQRIFETTMNPRQSVLIGAGLMQGMRRIETLRMTVGDTKNAIRSGILRIRGKGHKERCIPIHEEFRGTLERYLILSEGKDDNAPLLGIGRTQSENDLAEFCERYGRTFGFHTLRRTFGRNLWLREQKIETISELLGHSSTDMTRKYLGLNLSDMSKALACYKIARTCTYTKSLV